MTRIIAGKAGSLRLKAAASPTRPTSDRVKESLFAKLESMDAIDDAVVLDLFAGTGALAFEALSRGAKEAHLVDKDKQALAVCAANFEIVKKAIPEAKVEIKQGSATAFLKNCGKAFDLVFIDPPYDFENQQLADLLTDLRANLSANSLVVLERSTRTPAQQFEGFDVLQDLSYGDTRIFILALA